MNPPKLISKQELWEELGYSKSTFYRRCAEASIKVHHRMLSPEEQEYIRIKLGFPSLFSPHIVK